MAAGISIDGNAITGALNGIAESAGTIEGTVNNVEFLTIAVMFIGFALVVGFIHSLVGGIEGLSHDNVPKKATSHHKSSGPIIGSARRR